jgi:hypothetical protein
MYSYILSASVAIAATGMSAAMVTETASLRGTVPAETAPSGISVTAIEVAAIGISGVEVATAGVSAIDVATTIGVAAAIGISATVVFVLKATPIKATAVEISGISSFEKRPIVGIVGVIPIVTVPDGVVVVSIPGELGFKGYAVAVGIPISGVGISALIRRIGLLVDGRRRLVNRRRLLISRMSRLLINRIGFLGIAPGGY